MNYSALSKYRSELMGIAMLWVMLFHAWDLDLKVGILNDLRSAGFGGVDIFILLSAMGLVMSLSKREPTFSDFMARRAGRILPAYFPVMLVYTLFLILRGEAPFSTLIWNSSLLYYWVSPQGAFNWYIAGIMLFYALTPFCFRRLRSKGHRELWVAVGVVLALILCRILILDGYWSFLDVAYRFPIFFIGLLIGFYVTEGRRLTLSRGLFWAGTLVLGGAYLKLMGVVPSETFYLPLCHLFVFTTVPMCLALCVLFEKFPLGGLRKVLRVIGENSLEIYLLNVSFFSQTALLQRYLDFGPGHYLFYLITIPLNILLGVLLHRGVEGCRKALCRIKQG